MIKNIFFLLSLIAIVCCNSLKAQTVINDAIVELEVTTIDPSDSTFNMHSHEKYYYTSDCLRKDAWYDDGSFSIYFNGKSQTITTLESGGGESIYYEYSPKQWKEKSDLVVSKFEALSEQKTINGEICKSAYLYYPKGNYEKISYTSELIPQTEKNNTTKQNVPGFILDKEVYNKKKQLIQKVVLKSFQKIKSPKTEFIPDIKNYDKGKIPE